MNDLGRKLWTLLIFIVFFWMWPYRLFTDKNNCYFWTLEKILRYGGSVKWYKSKLWYGYHCTWLAPNGDEVEYNLPKMRKTNLFGVLWYDGVVKVRKRQRSNNS